MPAAELKNGRIEIASEYREREMIKLLPGGRWDTRAQTWWAPLSWATCIQLRGIFGSILQVGPELGAWAKNERETRVDPCLALRVAEDATLGEAFSDLYPFQRAGIKLMATSQQALNADSMGLGKTVQGILALELIGDDAFPALVVCPNSMKFKWQEEYSKWAPHRRTVVITGGKAARVKQIALIKEGEADVGIINWEGLRGHSRLAGFGSMQLSENDKTPKELNEIGFQTVVADEAHRAKSPKAAQTRALWWMGHHAKYRFMLTGTPIANSPEDIWSLMHFVAPDEFPSKTKFIDRYGLQSWNMFGGRDIVGLKSEHKEELFKILDPRFIRRTKEAVLPELPPAIPITRTVEMSPKQKGAYEMMRKEMIAELESGLLVVTNPLARMTRLLQFASAYGEVDEGGNLILTDPSCKVDALLEIVDELGDDRAIVFAESRQLIELAHKHLIRAKPHGPGLQVGLITGNVDVIDRNKYIADFNAGKLPLMLMTLGAGGEGLSFPGCSTAIFLQRSFSFVKNTQAEDRIRGIGRGTAGVPPTIIDIITLNTIESRVHEVRQEKADQLEEVARDKEVLFQWLMK